MTDDQIDAKAKAVLTARAKLRIAERAHGGASAPAAH